MDMRTVQVESAATDVFESITLWCSPGLLFLLQKKTSYQKSKFIVSLK